MTNREILADHGYEDLMVFESPDYDEAIIGVSHDDRVIYDYDKMIEHLVENENMDIEGAADFISYDTMRAIPYAGDGAPIIMFKLED
jgi:hypothetical protein